MCEHGGTDNRDLLGMLDAAADLLRAAGRVPLSSAVVDVALTQAVQKLEALARIAQGQKLGVVAEIAQREAHRGQAAGSTPDLLARVLHLAPGEARAQAELANGLALVPDTAAALKDGRIGISQAAVTVKKAEEVRGRDDAEELLAKIDATAASAGQRVDRNRLARELDTTIARSGVDVLAERERTAHARRRLDVTTRDGMTIVHAELDPVGGATVRAALDALSRKDGEQDRRSFPQRQADALVLLAKRALETKDEIAELGGIAREVILITTPESLHAQPGAQPSLLDGHGPVSPELASQLCCDARVTAVHTDHSGKILNVGRTARTATERQRAAVLARDKQCVGCGAPVSRCQIHHIKWWRDNGETNLDNLVLVCWNCHTHIHHMGWQITRDGTGRYRAGPPDLVPPHLENSIAKHTHAYAHTS